MVVKLVVTCGHVLVLWSVCVLGASPVHIYVSPHGSDSNTGLQASHPVKTLPHAVSMLQNDGIRGNTVFVELMEGYHDLDSTLYFRTSVNGTVVFRAYQGKEVHVSGGKRLSSSLFQHVSDAHVLQRLPHAARSKVLELDLAASGITNLGTLTTYGFYHMWKAPLELFINGRPLRLAEWPNGGKFINIRSVPDGEKGRRFTYDTSSTRDILWAQETEPWVYGWWYFSWADSSLPVAHVDPHTHTITLGQDSQFGLRVGHYNPDRSGQQVGFSKQGGYFRVINMLSELDEPGEYYVDRTNKKLYVWPNTPQQTLTSSDIVYASMLDHCISIYGNVHNLHFEDFTLENCRMYGFNIRDGRHLTFKNMEVKNTGSFGINCVKDCRDVSVLTSEFHDVGGGVRIQGGDRKTLTPSNVVIQDNHMWDHSRMGATTGDGVHIQGVHATVSYNHVHHGQYNAIVWRGNDHVIEYNDVHHACFNATDCGAIHTGRDWTFRGNVIRYNHIHHVLRYMPGGDVRGIMLDDEYSSVLIEHNVFYHNQVHANIGGGRDNVIRNNVMYNATSYSIQVDGRGLGSGGHGPILFERLNASAYQSDLWRRRYPELASILQHDPNAPKGNQIYNNAFYNPVGIPTVLYRGRHLSRSDYFDVHSNYQTHKKTDFLYPDYDFSLRCEATEWARNIHFQHPIARSEVGPRIPTGPNYLRVKRPFPEVTQTPSPAPSCDTTTAAPAPIAPQGAYMPDGSSTNTLFPNIPKEGCWFAIDKCPRDHTAEGTYKDNTGTATGTEEGCLARAAAQWKWCGSPSDGKVFAVYGPTGNFRTAGAGCWIKITSCPEHQNLKGYFYDAWGAINVGSDDDQMTCFNRASDFWIKCGFPSNASVTAFYRPRAASFTVP